MKRKRRHVEIIQSDLSREEFVQRVMACFRIHLAAHHETGYWSPTIENWDDAERALESLVDEAIPGGVFTRNA